MFTLFVAFFASLMLTLLVVRLSKVHGHLSLDHDTSGPQKFHARPVPRIGGLGIYIGLLVAAGTMVFTSPDPAGRWAFALLACGLPAFAAGLIEDVTKRVSPGKRLAATAFSALLAVWVLGAAITRTDIPGLEWVVGFALGSTLLTVFAVAGIANSVNIIDGFNGLASMCVVIMLTALAYVAFQVEDHFVATLALAGIGAVLGFFIWNFPAGLIFLGDGGAYFLGFYVAELSILLLARNGTVSPIFPLLVCIYPVFETLFSIYRRRFIRAVPPSMPDGIHLHSLIYRRVMRWAVGDARSVKALTRRNSMTSPYLWLLCMFSVVPAVLFWDNTPVLMLFLLLFVVTYVGLYWRIVRFKSPRWMRALATRPRPLEDEGIIRRS
ncbi:MAG: glycosyltransferase family 4 protein [Rubrivivax sp.]|nr:glycosyltransferase family 4 protein [Rubrivivax sp.]